jgi:hypothetical protein
VSSSIMDELRKAEEVLIPPLREEAGIPLDGSDEEPPDSDALWSYINTLEATIVGLHVARRTPCRAAEFEQHGFTRAQAKKQAHREEARERNLAGGKDQ